MTVLLRLAYFVILSITISTNALSQVQGDNPIPVQPKQLKPIEVIKNDTLPKAVKSKPDSLPGGIRIDEEYQYTPYQDTMFFRAMRLRIPSSVRFAEDARRAVSNLELLRKKLQESPWQIAMRNLQVSEEAYRPDPREVVNRQVSISNATAAPVFRPGQIVGMSATFDQIGSVLGLTEDVSPVLKYVVKNPEIVTVVVYSTAATVVSTLVKKVQQPGTYSVVWNLRDDKGRELPDGDYVLEARIGENAYYRKRVVIGSK